MALGFKVPFQPSSSDNLLSNPVLPPTLIITFNSPTHSLLLLFPHLLGRVVCLTVIFQRRGLGKPLD